MLVVPFKDTEANRDKSISAVLTGSAKDELIETIDFVVHDTANHPVQPVRSADEFLVSAKRFCHRTPKNSCGAL